LGLNLAIEHIGKNLRARSSGTSYLSNTALAQTHRSSSMASSWLNFFERKKTKKNTSKKLSQLRHLELANECES
jgi:hypothetical protein